MLRRAPALACLALILSVRIPADAIGRATLKPVSLHNRLLLNRLAVIGEKWVEVMLAVERSQFQVVSARIERAGGHIRRKDRLVGYIRARIPIERMLEVVSDRAVDAYQVSSLSKGSWYRDAPAEANAEMFRNREVGPIISSSRTPSRLELPTLSVERAKDDGYTADRATGVSDWLETHPHFDGRGITIALLESAQLEFAHPTLQTARTLDGREISKIAGVIDVVDVEDRDDTRVALGPEFRATSTWCRVGARTYIVPRPGRYRFGLFTLPVGKGLAQHVGVLRDEVTGEIRVDTDDTGDFSQLIPVSDVNTRFEVRKLRVPYPRPYELAFVVANGKSPNVVHVYLARDRHQTMTASVAAGSRVVDGFSYGVAPSARILLVRNTSGDFQLHDFLEGFLEAAQRPEVDVICDSGGIFMVPDTSRDFVGLFMSRIMTVYDKPIVHAAGNTLLFLNDVSSLGAVISVGSSLSPATFSALLGGGILQETMVHPISASGPALDGALKPDLLAPAQRLAADLFVRDTPLTVPKHMPTNQVPNGYQVSCCTSASSPYVAGVAALLLSAAKQQGVTYSAESLGRALRVGTSWLSDWPAHQQGNGLVNVGKAWGELQRRVEDPRIHASASNVHRLTVYTIHGESGVGLFEREGWEVGRSGSRTLQLRRESGSAHPMAYPLSWTGNDGTFNSATVVSLPLNEPVSMPVEVSVASEGVHSAILNLHDPVSGTIVFRIAVTIVASARFDDSSKSVRFNGSVALMRSRSHFFTVPEGIAAISIDLDVTSGGLDASILPPPGLHREYYAHVQPQLGRTFGRGSYHLVLPQPPAGTWSVEVGNVSAQFEPDESLVTTSDAEYSITIELLSASIQALKTDSGRIELSVANLGARLREPTILTSHGTRVTHNAELLRTGLPNQVAIEVPTDASALILNVHQAGPRKSLLDFYLYDCTSGECFNYDFTVVPAKEQEFVVRQPTPGRWVAAVNASVFGQEPGRFVLDEIITRGSADATPVRGIEGQFGQTVERTTATIERPAPWPFPPGSRASESVIVCELIDSAVQRDGISQPWENRPGLVNLSQRTVAIGRTIIRLN